MNALGRHIVALACLLAPPALATNDDAYEALDAWIDDRVRIFADVCFASAPGFARLDDLAATAGLTYEEERWILSPDVKVNLREHNNRCSCVMVMSAIEFRRQMASIILRLHEDDPETVQDPDGPGDFSKYFKRDGVLVRVVLESATFSDVDFIKGYVIGREPCPS